MLMKFILRGLILTGLLIGLHGCASMDLQMAASQPAPDWIYIHPGAKVGDRAVWNNNARSHHRIIWEVVGKQGDDLEVTLGWQDEYGSPGSEQSGLLRHFIVAPDGKVKRAFAKNYRTGDQVEMRVSAPGEVITRREMKMLASPQIIKTPAGSFTVDRVLQQNYHYRVLVTTVDTATVEFIDPKASFGVVRSLQDIDIGGLFLAKLITTVAEYSTTPKSSYDLYNALNKLDLSNEVKQNFVLINPQEVAGKPI
jgi:hypothetical protein